MADISSEQEKRQTALSLLSRILNPAVNSWDTRRALFFFKDLGPEIISPWVQTLATYFEQNSDRDVRLYVLEAMQAALPQDAVVGLQRVMPAASSPAQRGKIEGYITALQKTLGKRGSTPARQLTA